MCFALNPAEAWQRRSIGRGITTISTVEACSASPLCFALNPAEAWQRRSIGRGITTISTVEACSASRYPPDRLSRHPPPECRLALQASTPVIAERHTGIKRINKLFRPWSLAVQAGTPGPSLLTHPPECRLALQASTPVISPSDIPALRESINSTVRRGLQCKPVPPCRSPDTSRPSAGLHCKPLLFVILPGDRSKSTTTDRPSRSDRIVPSAVP